MEEKLEKKAKTAKKTAEEAASAEKEAKFMEKLQGLLAVAKKKKNMLEYQEINDYFRELELNAEQFEKILDFLEANNIDVLRITEDDDEVDEELLLNDDEEEIEVENIDLSVPDGVSIEDPVRMYLKEIGKVPLLSAEEEIDLAQKMEEGAVAKEKIAILKKRKEEAAEEEQAELDEEIKALTKTQDAGDEAKKRLAEANLRLVVSIAKRYVGRGMLFLDLIQEGNIGLMHAAEKYDYTKENRFSTYASWWIKEAMQRAIDQQSREIRVPVHVAENMKKVQKISKDLQQKFGREATPEEIAEEMKDKSPEFVKEILSYLQNPVSLETPVGEDGENNLGDMVEDKDATTPEDAMNQLVQKEEVQELLESLNDRERQVIRLRFGLEDGKTHTLEEIGDELNVTRERVRQIEARAMEKLRSKATKL